MTVLLAILKTTIFWFSGGSISVLLSNMEEDRKNAKTKEEARRMMRTAKICRRVSLSCIVTIRFVGRSLILRSYFPYDIQPTPNYELTVFAQMVAAYCTSGTYTTVDTFVITLIFHACGQYENLKQRLRNLPSQKGNEFKAELSRIVQKHDSLNRFADTIEERFNDMLLLQMLGCTIQLCVTCFLVTLSVGITDAVYECSWYDLSPNEAKSLMIIMLRARIPLHITAGKFCPFSHNLFSSILKTSMSYFLASGIRLRMELLHDEIHWDLARGKKFRSNLQLQSVNRVCLHHLVLHHTSIDITISPSKRHRNGHGKPIRGQHERNDSNHKDDMLLVQRRIFFHSFLFVVSIKDMKDLLSAMEEDWKEVTTKEDEKKMMKQAKFSRILATRATFICYALMGVYAVNRCLTMITDGRLLFLPAYFPYEALTSPKFELTIMGQIIGLVYYTTAYTTVDTFVAMLILHVCGQLTKLQNELIDLNSNTRKEFQIKLSYIVKRHDHLNRFVDTIEDRFNVMLLFQILGCTLQLCIECFQGLLIMAGEGEQMPLIEMFFFAFYIVYVLLQLYLYCYVGEQLWSESTEVARAAYECKWYNLLPNEARSLILIIRRSRSPLRLTAGKFCTFNHELYSSVLKTSMGYLSVLQLIINYYIALELNIFKTVIFRLYFARTYTAVDTFLAMLVLHVCGQLSRLRNDLIYLNTHTNKNFSIDLNYIVERHNHLNRFVDTIEKRFNIMLLFEILGCTLQLCMECFHGLVLMVDEGEQMPVLEIFFFTFYIIYVLLQLYLYCYVGEQLWFESTELARAAYECKWYELLPNEARTLLLIIHRSRSPLRLTAGKFCILNHELYSTVLKTSMSYLFFHSFLFVVSIKDMKDLLSAMEEDWKEVTTKEDEKKMMKQAKFSRILATRATFICYALIAVYAVKRCLSMRTDGRLLFLSAYFPYETMTSPIFELTFICQVIGSVYYTTAYTTVDTFVAMLILHVCGQLTRLQNELIDLNSNTRKEFQIKLSYIVKRHDHLNSTEVARAAYECKWYNLLPNEARSLILIIRRSRSPLRLTAGKFCTFNHELYSSQWILS
ncbi:odorant receptor 13a-like [Vespula squamosa]|uniref:Odorant receptor 13a-like n=1 Tax=Vespula squamosa TaxID=30214 RepID=A0ABD2A8T9_VESSQ